MISAHYIHCINIRFLKSALNSKALKFIKVRSQKSSFHDNVLGRKVAGKNGFIVDSISSDSVL